MHQVNVILHVISGTIALLLGILAIALNERVRVHKKSGKAFLYLLVVVVATGFIGWLFFRSDPFLLMLTILAGYDGFAGYRAIRLKKDPPTLLDVSVAAGALLLALLYFFRLSAVKANMSPAVVMSTMIALVVITVYDVSKYLFMHRFVKRWWLYEHIYKMIAGFSAIFSAFLGTVADSWGVVSRLGPTVVCTWMIVFFIWRRSLRA